MELDLEGVSQLLDVSNHSKLEMAFAHHVLLLSSYVKNFQIFLFAILNLFFIQKEKSSSYAVFFS